MTHNRDITLEDVLFRITPGTRLLTVFSGTEERIKSTYMGMERAQFFLIKPPLLAADSGIYDCLYPGNHLMVQFFYAEKIWAFKSQVQTYTIKPHPLVFINFPSCLPQEKLRKERRAKCYNPAEITYEGEKHAGYIVDVSRNGYRVVYKKNKTLVQPKIGATVTVKNKNIPAHGKNVVRCRVRRVDIFNEEIIELGLAFTGLSLEVSEQLKKYLEQSLGVLG